MPFTLDIANLPPLLRESDICRDPKRDYPGLLPITRSAFRDALANGYIPAPIKLGDKIVAWRREDILALIEHGVASRRGVVSRRESKRRALVARDAPVRDDVAGLPTPETVTAAGRVRGLFGRAPRSPP